VTVLQPENRSNERQAKSGDALQEISLPIAQTPIAQFPIQQIALHEKEAIVALRSDSTPLSQQSPPAIGSSPMAIQNPAPQNDVSVMNQPQAPITQSPAADEIQMPNAIPQQLQGREETRSPAYSSPDAIIRKPFMIPEKSADRPVERVGSILPYSEGLMGTPIENPRTKPPEAAPASIAKAPRYISTREKKRVSLKTASAAAGIPL
jgi:hypothetical protein